MLKHFLSEYVNKYFDRKLWSITNSTILTTSKSADHYGTTNAQHLFTLQT